MKVVLGSGDASLRVLKPPARSAPENRDQNLLGGRNENLLGGYHLAGGWT